MPGQRASVIAGGRPTGRADIEEQPPARRRRVDRFVQRHKVNAKAPDPLDILDQEFHRSGQPVKSRHDQSVPFRGGLQRALELRLGYRPSRNTLVMENTLASGRRLESFPLTGADLVTG